GGHALRDVRLRARTAARADGIEPGAARHVLAWALRRNDAHGDETREGDDPQEPARQSPHSGGAVEPHALSEDAEARLAVRRPDLDLEHVAGDERAHALRRPRHEEIARLERHHAARVSDE